MKSGRFSEKEKINAHRLPHKAYKLGNSKQNCGTLVSKNPKRKMDSLRVDRNWKRTMENVENQAVAPLKNSP